MTARAHQTAARVPAALERLIADRFPGAHLRSVRPLGADAVTATGATAKATGYGRPLLLTLEQPDGTLKRMVLRTATANVFGHDRRADRAADTLLAYDTFNEIPRHAEARDVGAVTDDRGLLSLAGAGELYLLTDYVEGTPYAEDLRRIADGGELEARDLLRCAALTRYLAELHRGERGRLQYRRSVRDLLGHGEGIFGIVDAYPRDTPAAPPERLQELERACLEWRWHLRQFEQRATRIHGDFHPFNILFGPGVELHLLDAARGCVGDPADDVTALAVNYLFFAIDAPGAWQRGLSRLWDDFWTRYLDQSGDVELTRVVAPYLTWRLLVVAQPLFYPGLSPHGRDLLLSLAERALVRAEFHPSWAHQLFEPPPQHPELS